jgi:Na+/H+ antiporter NhaD/arsenite permease-like protein
MVGFHLRSGHVSRRWGRSQLLCLAIILVWAIAFAWSGQRPLTRSLGWVAAAGFAVFVVLSFLSKRENDRDEKPFP